MSQIRVNKLEGHYTIKILEQLPKRGNANWLYSLKTDNLSVFYFWTLGNEYERIDLSDSISSVTSIQAGANITITGTGTLSDPYVVNSIAETAQQTSVAPVGNLTSTDVQSALEELQSDFDSISTAEENVQSDWDQTDNTQDDYINNKPTNTSDFVNDGADGTNPFITINDLPSIPEYTLSPISGTNELDLLKDGVSVSQIDLTPYLDDTNLSRLVSGTLDGATGILTVTRDDSSVFTIDLSELIDIQPTNTSDLINDGADSTSTYVENDEITDAAKVGLSIRDVNNVEQFKVEEFVQIQGATFDSVNKRVSNDPLEAFTVFIHNTNGSDTTGELNNENKPFATLNNAITAVLAQKGELSNYRFVILDSTVYEIVQPVQDLKTLHIDSLSNSPTIIQRTSFGLSEAFILKGFGMKYRIEPDSNFTTAFSTSASMLSLNSCDDVFFEFGGFEFSKDNPPTNVNVAIRYYGNTIFSKFKILGQTSTQEYANGEWFRDGYNGNIIAEQGICEDVIFPNSGNLLSKNIVDEYVYTGTGTDTLASLCEMELGGIFVPNSGTVRLSFAVSVKLNNATLNNTNFVGQSFNRVDRGNTLSGRATVVWNKNYNYLFNPSGNDTKFSGIPINNIETNILKDLHLIITSDNQARCQQQLIRYLDTDYPTQNMVFDNTTIEFDQNNRDVFLTGGTTTTFGLGGAAGWTRDNDTYCLIFRNTNKFFGGAYLFRWLGTLDYNQAKYLVTENGSLEFNGLGLSTNTDLRLHNIDGFDYTYDDISVQDSNGVEQFKLERDDFIQLQGGTFDISNKKWAVDPLQYNTFFIKVDGNDTTGELNNANKPFATLNGAIDSYQANTPQPSGSFSSNYIFEILDANTYTWTQNLYRAFSTGFDFQSQPPVITIRSAYPCTINASNPNTGTTLVLMHNENNVRHVWSKLIVDIPNGNFNLIGANNIQICPTSNSSLAVLDINCDSFTKSAPGNGLGRISQNTRTGVSNVNINNITISNTGSFIERVETDGIIDLGKINISSTATVVSALNFKEFGFDNITATSSFVLCSANQGTIRHGDIDASAVTTQFRYINGASNQDYDSIIIYKDNCRVLGNLTIHGFNSGRARYKLFGNSVYYQSDYVFYHEDVPIGGIGIDVNVRKFECENDFVGGGRTAVTVRLVNCYFKVGGFFNRGIISGVEAGQWNSSGEEYSVLIVEGTCVIDADVVDGTTVIQNLNNPAAQGNAKLYVNGDLLMIKGIIDFTNIDLIKEPTLNRY